MDYSSIRSADSPRSLHELLGGGIVADVMLWKRRHVTIGTLLGTLAAWVVFEVSGYTLLSLLSNVLLLLLTILFVWAKAAQILNRPPPPIPQMHISEEVIREVAAFMHPGINMMLSIFHDIALGKDSKLFYGVAIYLWLISIVGSLTDFPTMIYTSLIIVLTIPALYEKYEECIDRYMKLAYMEVWMYERIYERVSMKCFNKIMNCIIEILKES
ncbi:reticulon-like protein B12 isoform X2 [Typha angustifolia]|uniref:reticulon-like protein B12 isoform X2 n=1 Tax=Typha angustifolia TaxID=59011 RepID=UPI003C2D536B